MWPIPTETDEVQDEGGAGGWGRAPGNVILPFRREGNVKVAESGATA